MRRSTGPPTASCAGARAQLAGALQSKLGVGLGDRVATLAWNDHRHFELYYGIAGIGAVCHTINPRLFPEQIAYIVGHARDRYLFIDPMFLPLVEQLAPELKTLEGIVVLCDAAHLPASGLAGLIDYESLIADQPSEFTWPDFDETTACGLCYTSGTTGHPKGALYHHRSTVLHALTIVMPDVMGLSARDTVLPVVPMFHVNAWGLPYACPLVGARMVMPGPRLDGASLYEQLERERVTFAAGVPTVWFGVLDHLREIQGRPAASRAAGDRRRGAAAVDDRGLREPVPGRGAARLGHDRDEPGRRGLPLAPDRGRHARPPSGNASSRSRGRRSGASSSRSSTSRGGVCRTTARPQACSTCADPGSHRPTSVTRPPRRPPSTPRAGSRPATSRRSIRRATCRSPTGPRTWSDRAASGSARSTLENAAVGHPDLAEAAVIAVAHPKWGERPLLIAVRRPGAAVDKAAILDYLAGKVASWWLPDDVVFVEELPHTATGKLMKTALRERFKDHVPPTA